MEAKVKWESKMNFTGTAESGFSVPIGARSGSGIETDGFYPMELFAIALASCTAMDVISILNKKRQDVTNFEVALSAERALEHPKVFTSATIEYLITGRKLDEAAIVRSIELSATRYCPAQAMFDKVFPIELKYRIYEDFGENGRQEVKAGVYQKAEVLEPD